MVYCEFFIHVKKEKQVQDAHQLNLTDKNHNLTFKHLS